MPVVVLPNHTIARRTGVSTRTFDATCPACSLIGKAYHSQPSDSFREKGDFLAEFNNLGNNVC